MKPKVAKRKDEGASDLSTKLGLTSEKLRGETRLWTCVFRPYPLAYHITHHTSHFIPHHTDRRTLHNHVGNNVCASAHVGSGEAPDQTQQRPCLGPQEIPCPSSCMHPLLSYLYFVVTDGLRLVHSSQASPPLPSPSKTLGRSTVAIRQCHPQAPQGLRPARSPIPVSQHHCPRTQGSIRSEVQPRQDQDQAPPQQETMHRSQDPQGHPSRPSPNQGRL